MKKLFMIFVAVFCCISIYGSENQGELIKQQRREKAEKKQEELLHKLARKPACIFEPIIGSDPAIKGYSFQPSSPIGSMVDTKREMEKEMSVSSWAKSRSGGFEGCKNKKECGFEGSYLYPYSPEGLCDDCNFKEHPERFVACLFCRAPNIKREKSDMSRSCSCCPGDVEDLLIEKLKCPGQEATSHWRYVAALPNNIKSVINNSAKNMAVQSIAALKIFDIKWKIFDEKGSGPHFYYGAFHHKNDQGETGSLVHLWVNDFDLEDEDQFNIRYRDDSESALELLFKKYNLFGPVTGYDIGNNPPKYISAIYEEMIDKK